MSQKQYLKVLHLFKMLNFPIEFQKKPKNDMRHLLRSKEVQTMLKQKADRLINQTL